MIIAVDFDGTVVTHEYPEVGQVVPGAVEVLQELTSAGHKIICYTMRSGKELNDAQTWFHTNGIDVWGYNCNPHQLTWTNSPKVYAQIYIDDAALGCPLRQSVVWKTGTGQPRPFVDWARVREGLVEKGALKARPPKGV